MSELIMIDGEPRSSCHHAEVQRQVDYTDTHVYVINDAETDDAGNIVSATYSLAKTYDGMDGSNVVIACRECGREIENADAIDFQES